MKVLILANKPPYPTKDGSSLATLNMAAGLAEQGVDVTVLAISTQKHPSTLEQIPQELKEKIKFHLIEVDTRISLLKAINNLLFSNLPYNVERFINQGYTNKLKELINSTKFDLIQLEGLYLLPYTSKIKELTDKPIIYRSHNLEYEIWQRLSLNEKNWLKAKYFRLLSKRLLKLEKSVTTTVSAVVTISKKEEDWFNHQDNAKPSIYIPAGFKAPIQWHSTNEEQNKLCFIGSLDWIPNQEGLKWFIDDTWPLAIAKNSKLELHIAGRNASKAFATYLKSQKRIVFHGEVEDSKQFLSQYQIMIVPLLSGSGMRVKIIEGMFLRLAIVSTPIGCEGIDVTSGENIIIANTPDEFAKGLEVLTQSPEIIDRISSNAFTFADENFNIAKLTEKLINFYKNII